MQLMRQLLPVFRYKVVFGMLAGLFVLFSTASFALDTVDIRIYSIYVNRGDDNVTISFKTSPDSIAKVEYANTEGEWKETPWTDEYRADHSFTLLNLDTNATYLYRLNAEDVDGRVETKTGNFTTLDGETLGLTDTDPPTADEGGFKELLSPAATATPTITNVLGAQTYPYGYYPIPFLYQPVLGVQDTTPPTAVEPTSTPVPTPTAIIANSGLEDNGSLTLIIGIVAGVTIAYLIHQITEPEKVKNSTSRFLRKDDSTSSAATDVSSQESDGQTYQFSVNHD